MRSLSKLILSLSIFISLLGCQIQASVLTTDLVGYWSGDGHANDSSGNGNHGTLQNGASFRAGVSGQAFNLDGNNDWISTAFTMANDQSHTISAWVYLDSMPPQEHQEIVSWWNLSVPFENRMFLGISTLTINNDGPLRYGDAWRDAPGPISIGEWTHIVASYDGTDNTRKIYINGSLVGTKLSTGEAQFPTTMAIGRQGDGDFEYWDGAIDELAIYNTVLSDSQVQQLAGNVVPEPSTYALMLIGIAGLVLISYRRRMKAVK